MSSAASLVDRVLDGSNRNLQVLAAGGLLPLAPSELIPLQIRLTRSLDPEVSDRARTSLRALSPRTVANYLADDAPPPVLSYFALEVDDPVVVQTILQRRDVPYSLLRAMAANLSPDLQEILLLRQDAIVDEPAILVALEGNPHLSLYSKRRIAEYREHLLPRERKFGTLEDVPEATDEEVAQAIAEVKAKTGEKDVDVEKTTGLSEAQLRLLPVPVRMRLTRGASRALRQYLFRDPNPMVAIGCLMYNNINEQEIEGICQNRNSHEDLLLAITRDRRWMSRYPVIVALARNPRTPAGIAMRLVSRLSVFDLRDLRRDRNVPESVRRIANQLYSAKQK